MSFLNRLRRTLSEAYDTIRHHSGYIEDEAFYAVNVFNDNIVIGYPLYKHHMDYGEPELLDVLLTFSEFQIALILEGFFVRGGISFGDHYMDDDIVFGDALLEAVNQNKAGGVPCISLSPSALELIRNQLKFYGDITMSPQHEFLLQNHDNKIFLNYMYQAFRLFPDGGILFDIIDSHKRHIMDNVLNSAESSSVRAKFEWLARYHNFICHEFLRRYPIPNDSCVDEIYLAATLEAQKLVDYIIDIESFSPTVRRIDLPPLDYNKLEI